MDKHIGNPFSTKKMFTEHHSARYKSGYNYYGNHSSGLYGMNPAKKSRSRGMPCNAMLMMMGQPNSTVDSGRVGPSGGGGGGGGGGGRGSSDEEYGNFDASGYNDDQNNDRRQSEDEKEQHSDVERDVQSFFPSLANGTYLKTDNCHFSPYLRTPLASPSKQARTDLINQVSCCCISSSHLFIQGFLRLGFPSSGFDTPSFVLSID
ncbi:hypothetical protein Ciccas_000426 [Cichlidogyrus casuarinus]|uniref:Uncharacterized protein n=1 Tax=Cichlidogyrus casuarinus TaxID=1844966 RepID=A0ABD2QN85_9PLAT